MAEQQAPPASIETRELMERMRDDAAANGDHKGAAELDEALKLDRGRDE